MQHDQFSRLLRLAQKTGDRLIVTGAEGMEPVVILPLDEYESLIENALGLSERGYEVAEEWSMVGEGEEDEADFDQDELERGALKDLWQDPQGEATAMEVIERPEPELPQPQPSHEPEPVPEIVLEQPVREAPKMANIRPLGRIPAPVKKPVDGGEEQFYLEPI